MIRIPGMFLAALLAAAPAAASFDFLGAGSASSAKATRPAPSVAPTPAVAEAPAVAMPAGAASAVAAIPEEYRIGANDLVEVSVFQVPELNRTVRVNSRGLVSLPLIGMIAAAGLTGTELESRIADKLRENYLQDPQVSVFIKEFTSQRVTVEGQVEKAGIFPITGQTTLLQALALSGGITKIGDKEVSVFRLTADGMRQMASYDVDQIRSGKVVDPVVKNNDIIVVGTNEVRSFIETIRGFISFGTLR